MCIYQFHIVGHPELQSDWEILFMPDKNLRAVNWLAKTDKRILTRPAVGSREERGLLSRTAAGNRAYKQVRVSFGN